MNPKLKSFLLIFLLVIVTVILIYIDRFNKTGKDVVIYIPMGSEIREGACKPCPVKENEVVYVFDIDNTLYVGDRMIKMETMIVEDIFEMHMKEEYKNKNLNFRSIRNESKDSYDFIFKKYCGIPRDDFYDNDIMPNLITTYVLKKHIEESGVYKKLKDLRGRKFCCTNGGYKRAKKNIEYLGVDAHIEAVYHLDHNYTSNIYIKPNENVFKYMENTLKIKNRSNVYFFDDEEKNCTAAKKFGWNSYLITKENTIIKALEQAEKDIENKSVCS